MTLSSSLTLIAILSLLSIIKSLPAPQERVNLLDAFASILGQVSDSQQFKDGMVMARERVSDIQENIPDNFTSTIGNTLISFFNQQRENMPANFTSTIRANLISVIQQQNITGNIPAIRSFIEDNSASLPEGVDVQTVLDTLPTEEDGNNLRSAVVNNIPDTDTINNGIQTFVENIPEDAIDQAANLLTNLFG